MLVVSSVSFRRLVLLLVLGAPALMLVGCAAPAGPGELTYFPAAPATAHAVRLASGEALNDFMSVDRSWLDRLRGRITAVPLEAPAGLAWAQGSLYVCDRAAGVVQVWDLEAGRVRLVGGGVLSKPAAVAVAPCGTLFVADAGLGEVVSFSAEGVERTHFKPVEREKFTPVAVALANKRLLVADTAGQGIEEFKPDGTYVRTIGAVGAEAGQFLFPMGLACDAAGNVLVSDMLNGRVQVLGADFAYQRAFGQPGDRYGDFGKPKQLAVGPDGVVFVADAAFGHVTLFDGEGRLLMLLGYAPGASMPFGVAATASEVPASLAELVPDGFDAHYFLFVSHTTGERCLDVYAIGLSR